MRHLSILLLFGVSVQVLSSAPSLASPSVSSPSLAPTSLSASKVTGAALAQAAMRRTESRVTYNGAYRALSYPGGDVPADQGVCTDVLIRSYRALGVDLQVLVHEDMQTSFSAYPSNWGLSKPDANIDHRRVPNLETFFTRTGSSLTNQSILPGDVVSFRLANGLPHIGIVSNKKVPNTERYYVVHNVGAGPKAEDVLTRYRRVGHYRFLPAS